MFLHVFSSISVRYHHMKVATNQIYLFSEEN
jgi:hypothetical protein